MGQLLNWVMEGIVDYIAPALCVHCEKPLMRGGASSYLCNSCLQTLISSGETSICIEAGVHALYPLNAVVRSLIHALKYKEMPGIASELVRWSALGGLGALGLRGRVYLIPVPLASARMRERGYNQAERVALAVIQKWGGVVYPGVLKRKKYQGSQTRLDAESRAWNVAGAFTARPPVPDQVLIVDDVYTTGATTNACRYALMHAGAKRIHTLALAYDLPSNGVDDWKLDMEYFKRSTSNSSIPP